MRFAANCNATFNIQVGGEVIEVSYTYRVTSSTWCSIFAMSVLTDTCTCIWIRICMLCFIHVCLISLIFSIDILLFFNGEPTYNALRGIASDCQWSLKSSLLSAG